MRTRDGHLAVFLMLAAIAFIAAAANGQATFTEAVSDDYAEGGNWTTMSPPTTDDTMVIGSSAYPGVTCTIYSPTIAAVGSCEFAQGGDGTLNIEAGASLDAGDGWLIMGYGGGFDATATINVSGVMTDPEGGNVTLGGWANGSLTINEGGTFTTASWTVIGEHYNGTGGYNVLLDVNGGLFENTYEWGLTAVEINQSSGASCLVRVRNGGTIRVDQGWFHNEGTFEVADGGGTIDTSPRFYSGSDGDITLKFSGTDPLLTVTGGYNFGTSGLTYIDVSELTLTAGNTWVTVMEAGYGLNPDSAALDPGTDANVWSMQWDGANLQLMQSGGPIMGDVNLSTCVDDDDLSLLLANWNIGTTWGTGDLNASGNVDDDDLSLLLANWGAGCSPAPEAVPEPASALILLLGLTCVARRRMRR
jgi:hypothetical protein